MSKVTLKDIVDGTPEGQKAVKKAVKQSIKDQQELTAKAKTTPPNEAELEKQIWDILTKEMFVAVKDSITYKPIEPKVSGQYFAVPKIMEAILASYVSKARLEEALGDEPTLDKDYVAGSVDWATLQHAEARNQLRKELREKLL